MAKTAKKEIGSLIESGQYFPCTQAELVSVKFSLGFLAVTPGPQFAA
jgi:hypothetical protein